MSLKWLFNNTSINTDIMKHNTTATIAYLDDIKPNPLININMLPINSRIIEIKPVVG